MPTVSKHARRAAALLGCLLLLCVAAPRAAAQDEAEGYEAALKELKELQAKAKAEETPANSTVSGRAVFDDTGRPVRRARVMLLHIEGGTRSQPSTLTDARGEFRLKGVPAGKYFAVVDLSGVLSPVSFINLEEAKAREPDLSEVRKHFDEIEVDGKTDKEITVRARRGAAIGGRVTYADGDPAVGVSVHLMRMRGGVPVPFLNTLGVSGIFGQRTNDRGEYRIAGLPPGEYIVGAAEPVEHGGAAEAGVFGTEFGPVGSPFAMTYHPSAPKAARATAVSVETGDERADVDILIAERPAHSIAGVVRGKRDARPVVGATVAIENKEAGSSLALLYGGVVEHQVKTDEAGRWQFKEMPDGVYEVSVGPPTEYSAPTATDESPAGSDGGATGRGRAPVQTKKYAPKKVQVRVSGGDLADVLIELTDGARISGTVAFEGKKRADSYVYLYATPEADGREQPGGEYTSGTNDGTFDIAGVPAGKTYLRLSYYGPGPEKAYLKSATWRGRDLLREPLEVAEGAHLSGVQVVVSAETAKLRLRALSEKSREPAQHVFVALAPADSDRWTQADAQAGCLTGVGGACDVSAAPGEYIVIALPHGARPGSLDADDIKARASGAPRLTLRAGEDKTFEVSVPEKEKGSSQ